MRLLPFDSQSTENPKIQLDASARLDGAEIVFTFRVSGALARLNWENGKDVKGSATKRFDELWKHTCFEAFVKGPPKGQNGAYWEFNVAPNGAWNCYHFDRYREGMRAEAKVTGVLPRFSDRGGEAELSWRVPLSLFGCAPSELQIGLTAVIVTRDEKTSYWAIAHAGTQADFHLAESFVARVPGSV